MRYLIVEDDAILAEAVKRHFEKQGNAADMVSSGTLAHDILRHNEYDLIVLDLNLPGMSGGMVLKRLRDRRSPVPVIILTARDQVEDRIAMFNLGADDYLTKPFDMGELEARCRALLRRNSGDAQDVVQHGNLTFDRNRCSVKVNEQAVELKRREYRLLEILLSHKGRVLSKEELLDHLYGFSESPSPNAIETYVARLRKKLCEWSIEIRTLRGLGYIVEKA